MASSKILGFVAEAANQTAGWTHVSHVEQDRLPLMLSKDRVAEQGDVDGPLECGLALEMVAVEARLRRCRHNKPLALSLGLVPTTQWKNHDFKLNTTVRCSKLEITQWVAQKNILELTTRDMPRRKTEDSQTFGTLTMVTSSVTILYRPSYLKEFDAATEKTEQAKPTEDRRHSYLDLAVACAFPPHASGFTLQVLDLAHIWSDSDTDVIDLDDTLALSAAVHMFIKLNLLPGQRYLHTLPELLTAVAALLTRHQPDDVPVLHTARTIQQITHVQFRILELLEFDLATLTPAAWVEITLATTTTAATASSRSSARFPRFPRRTSRVFPSVLVPQPVVLVPLPGLSRQRRGYRYASLQKSDLMPAPSHDSLPFARTSRGSHSCRAFVLVQRFISVLWLVLAIRTVCEARCRNFVSYTINSFRSRLASGTFLLKARNGPDINGRLLLLEGRRATFADSKRNDH